MSKGIPVEGSIGGTGLYAFSFSELIKWQSFMYVYLP
jgi:hypothetical protein